MYPDDRSVGEHIIVQLLSGASGTAFATGYTNDHGIVEFAGVPEGSYRILVSGEGVQRTETQAFEMNTARVVQTEFVTVQPVASKESANMKAGATVNSAELAMPDNARNAFEKGNQALAREDWNKALLSLKKSIELYPQYAPAYNNLGVVYKQMHDAVQERAAFEKAISLDEHYAAPYLNLGELCIRQKQYAEAEKLLEKTVALNPNSSKGYMLLADAELMNREYEAAIISAKRAHGLPHEGLALTHYIAAKAYEQQNQPKEAVAELQLFLKEEPSGPRADQVRAELKQIEPYAQ
jgi:tetratricopeptide (TPR) repeat protein